MFLPRPVHRASQVGYFALRADSQMPVSPPKLQRRQTMQGETLKKSTIRQIHAPLKAAQKELRTPPHKHSAHKLLKCRIRQRPQFHQNGSQARGQVDAGVSSLGAAIQFEFAFVYPEPMPMPARAMARARQASLF